jgi:hypothetical protein
MENMINGMITEEEKALADNSIDMALEAGASAVQVTLDKAKTEIIVALSYFQNKFPHPAFAGWMGDFCY